MKILHALLISAIMLVWPICIYAEQTAEPNSSGKDTANGIKVINSITIAIANFESKAPTDPNIGTQISDILTARLSVNDQFQLVERQKLDEILKETGLNLTGMVDPAQAIKVGKMLGAKIMVFGRAFPVDKELYIVAKIVSTETTKVKGVMAKGKLEGELSKVIDMLAENLAEGLEKWSPELLPKNEKLENKIEILKKRLAGKQLPLVAVRIPEMHVNRQVIDPAAETEIKKILKEVGFTVIEFKDQKPQEKVDIIIKGEGFSEYAGRFGGLVSCSARLEVEAVEQENHNIITSERTTRKAVDLSEEIAGKTALQAAGNELAIEVITKIAQSIDQKK